jgi:hypothetical protein
MSIAAAVALSACSDASKDIAGPSLIASRPTAFFASVSAASEGHRAGVFIDLAGRCGMFDGNGALVGPLDAKINVVTQGPNGNALHNCVATVENPTGRAIRYDSDNNPLGIPLGCRIYDDDGNFVVTFHVHEQISASGRAHLICVATGSP